MENNRKNIWLKEEVDILVEVGLWEPQEEIKTQVDLSVQFCEFYE